MTMLQDDLPEAKIFDHDEKDRRKKRGIYNDDEEVVQDDIPPEKRLKDETTNESAKVLLGLNAAPASSSPPSSGTVTATRNGDTGSVQHLVALFGALVAQGEKAAASLEIIISSLSSDVLAEVVMANMCFLPANCPIAEEEDNDSKGNIASQPSTFIKDIFSFLTPQSAASENNSVRMLASHSSSF